MIKNDKSNTRKLHERKFYRHFTRKESIYLSKTENDITKDVLDLINKNLK